MRQRRVVGGSLTVMAVAAAGCGSDPVDVDPAVAPFVGTWDAVVMTATADAPPHTVFDVLAAGGTFWISVEPSGQYTATLAFLGPHVELGDMTVESSSSLTLHPLGGDPAPSTYLLATPDSLILDGATEFDFNLDGTPESAQGHIELVRQ